MYWIVFCILHCLFFMAMDWCSYIFFLCFFNLTNFLFIWAGSSKEIADRTCRSCDMYWRAEKLCKDDVSSYEQEHATFDISSICFCFAWVFSGKENERVNGKLLFYIVYKLIFRNLMLICSKLKSPSSKKVHDINITFIYIQLKTL